MRVKSIPHLDDFGQEENGIKRVLEAYFKYLPDHGIEFVSSDSDEYDLLVAHAGMGSGSADVAHLHGMYWTADYNAPKWEYKANERIVRDIRQAQIITVPSKWVAETFQRDMRVSPRVIGHGIDCAEWEHDHASQNYVLWNKNRSGDVCSVEDVDRLAKHFPDQEIIATFGAGANVSNISSADLWQLRADGSTPKHLVTGIRSHPEMKRYVQQAGVYLSTTKETFGIGVLEAMASGVPVLGYDWGGNQELVQHGVNGFLARDFDELCIGLQYCLKHRATLGANGRALAQNWTWEHAIERVAHTYIEAHRKLQELPTVGVVIPVYKKLESEVERALKSVYEQTHKADQIVLVNDGSDHDYSRLADKYGAKYIFQTNKGVAAARNRGIQELSTKYVCCLDADDWIVPQYLSTCVQELQADRSISIAYTALTYHKPDGETGVSEWPGFWDFDAQLARRNQIPTCCVFTRDMWKRLGGYKSRYCPRGAGSEDAELWTRAGAYGFAARKVSDLGLFHYSWLSGQTAQEGYNEVDWLAWHPWATDRKHPFASYATPVHMSHPVRQYDEPIISVIIPVGEGHEQLLRDALDSLEAQTFRNWEAIIVLDFNMKATDYHELWNAYPYAKIEFSYDHKLPSVADINHWKSRGAGAARNKGARVARAELLLFLDADDTLHPDALELMLEEWSRTKEIVYTDYVGQAYIELELAQKLEDEGRLQSFDQNTGEAIISYQAFDFDCARALRQPERQPYIWCNISSLVPKIWHDEINGFDEQMETWEDWDYWLRLARAGKCFTHLKRELLRYRFYTGKRRDIAASDGQKATSMIVYLHDKFEGQSTMGCNCKDKTPQVAAQEVKAQMSDDNYVRARYTGARGNHHIIGAYHLDFDPGLPTKRVGTKWAHYYGYASEGYVALVHTEDIRLMVGKWEIIPDYVAPERPETVLTEPEPLRAHESDAGVQTHTPTPPTPLDELSELPQNGEGLDLQTIPGVTGAIAKEFEKRGLTDATSIRAAGEDGLQLIRGVGAARAKAIIQAVTDQNT